MKILKCHTYILYILIASINFVVKYVTLAETAKKITDKKYIYHRQLTYICRRRPQTIAQQDFRPFNMSRKLATCQIYIR